MSEIHKGTRRFDDVDADSVTADNATVYGATTTEVLEANKARTRSGYSDVSASRAFNTSEINGTGSDLDVSVAAQTSTDNTRVDIRLFVDGVKVNHYNQVLGIANDVLSVSGTVPSGSTYEVKAAGDTANYAINQWAEQE